MATSDKPGPSIAWLPTDLLAVVLLVLVTNAAVFLPLIRDTPLRIVVGIPFLLFVPGYALVAALFPESGDARTNEQGRRWPSVSSSGPPIGVTERVVFSFTASLVIVPLLGFLLDFSPYGIRTAPVVAAVSAVTIVLVAIGIFRRNSLPPGDRFDISLRSWLAPLRTDSVHLGANVLVAIGLVVALSGLGYALATPTDEPFTEFYLVTESDSGEYVANGYPRNLTVGETHSITTVTANHGDSARTYTVVVLLQRVRTVEDEITVVEEAEQSRSTFRVPAHDVGYNPVTAVPSIRGDDLRLTYLLYIGDPPADPSPEDAEHTLYLWVDVAGSEDAGSADLPTR